MFTARNVFILYILLVSCQGKNVTPLGDRSIAIADDYFAGNVSFQGLKSTTGFKVLLQDTADVVLDQIVFRYIPYHFDTADVNHDGSTEILIGLIKPTEFDPVEKKRLFIVRVDDGHLRPLWLGSKVCQELVNFKSLASGDLQTLERTSAGNYAIGNYYWQSFGLTLGKYTHTEIPLDEALNLFHHAN